MTAPDDIAAEPDGAPRAQPDRSYGRLFGDLADELRNLFRLETTLLKLELADKGRRLGLGLIAVALGGLLALSGWLALLAAAILGLSTVLRPWLAALTAGIAALLAAALLLLLGRRWLAARGLAPRRTAASLREDAAWIKERLS